MPPRAKIAITIPPQVLAQVEQRAEGNVSGALARSLDRYFALLARSLAEWRDQLSDKECALILDATNGTAFADTLSLNYLWAEVADACGLDGLDEKWEVDGQALVDKIKAGGMAGQAALVDASERWWNRVAAGEQPPWSDLLAAGPAPKRYPENEA